jgi:hypothetical protein
MLSVPTEPRIAILVSGQSLLRILVNRLEHEEAFIVLSNKVLLDKRLKRV